MNPYNASANTYKSMEVTSCNRLKLIVMVYNAAIASLKQAVETHERNDLPKRDQYISRAQYIIYELNNALDMQRGQEIAASLRRLYHFLTRHLGDVLHDNNIRKVNESLKIMENIRDAWQEIAQKALKDEPGLNRGAAIYHSNSSTMSG